VSITGVVSRLLLALCVACSSADADGPQGHVRTDYGFCGTLQVSHDEAVTPAHCLDASERTDCALLRDLCWIPSSLPVVAEIRTPLAGEEVIARLPDGRSGASVVLDVDQSWLRANIDYACARGDSGGVVWGSDGKALCMLTGCHTNGTGAWCDLLTAIP
jgi:hypothetical protein